MRLKLDEAVKLLFPRSQASIKDLLQPLRDDRVRWAVLALSRGDLEKLDLYLKDGLRDYRDVLVGAESMSPDPRGALLRRFPASEELAFRLVEAKLHRLGFFDRLVRSGAALLDPPYEPREIVIALTEQRAAGFGPADWRDVTIDTAHTLALHVMNRSFAPEELARAPELLSELSSFGEPERALASTLPDELPVDRSGRPHRGHGPLNYRVGVILLEQMRAWGLWMEHRAG